MIHQLALAAALSAPSVIRPIAPSFVTTRFVRLRLDVAAYGIHGAGEIDVDRANGRFVRRFDVGPVSEREGWDGVRAWRADATGMPRIEGNVDERTSVLEWSRLLAPDAGGAPREPMLRPPDESVDSKTGDLTAVVRHIGQQDERTTFGDYRDASGFHVPFTIADVSESGVWNARVNAVETPSSIATDAFAPPPEPNDASLGGIAAVDLIAPIEYPTVAVSLNGAAPLRFLLDTGGQNVISPSAAKHLGIDVVGGGTVGGGGAGLAKVRYATVRSVRVGAAEMRDQPFIVLDVHGSPFDGIIGYELLARFAARIDFRHQRLQLARDGRAFARAGVEVPMVFNERQPQVDGDVDGIPATLAIDTGSPPAVIVYAPFVRAHDLITRYHALPARETYSGVGGPVRTYLASARELRLGEQRIDDVPLLLADAKAGGEANPTIAANIGDDILRRFTVVLDYRAGMIRFETPER